MAKKIVMTIQVTLAIEGESIQVLVVEKAPQSLTETQRAAGVALIKRLTQSMLAGPTGALAAVRAEQVFGMLQFAEVFSTDRQMQTFLEAHHQAILHSLRQVA